MRRYIPHQWSETLDSICEVEEPPAFVRPNTHKSDRSTPLDSFALPASYRDINATFSKNRADTIIALRNAYGQETVNTFRHWGERQDSSNDTHAWGDNADQRRLALLLSKMMEEIASTCSPRPNTEDEYRKQADIIWKYDQLWLNNDPLLANHDIPPSVQNSSYNRTLTGLGSKELDVVWDHAIRESLSTTAGLLKGILRPDASEVWERSQQKAELGPEWGPLYGNGEQQSPSEYSEVSAMSDWLVTSPDAEIGVEADSPSISELSNEAASPINTPLTRWGAFRRRARCPGRSPVANRGSSRERPESTASEPSIDLELDSCDIPPLPPSSDSSSVYSAENFETPATGTPSDGGKSSGWKSKRRLLTGRGAIRKPKKASGRKPRIANRAKSERERESTFPESHHDPELEIGETHPQPPPSEYASSTYSAEILEAPAAALHPGSGANGVQKPPRQPTKTRRRKRRQRRARESSRAGERAESRGSRAGGHVDGFVAYRGVMSEASTGGTDDGTGSREDEEGSRVAGDSNHDTNNRSQVFSRRPRQNPEGNRKARAANTADRSSNRQRDWVEISAGALAASTLMVGAGLATYGVLTTLRNKELI